MVVLRKQCFILEKQDNKCEESAFVGNLGTLKSIDVVDACLAYDCNKTSKTILLVFRNALYIPNMKHHLIPPFILHDAGVKVNDTHRVHCDQVILDSHSIWFEDAGVRIPLQLDGIFSTFKTRKPTEDEILHTPKENTCYYTPGSNT